MNKRKKKFKAAFIPGFPGGRDGGQMLAQFVYCYKKYRTLKSSYIQDIKQ